MYKSQLDPSYKINTNNIVYINSGVVVIPPNFDLKSNWEKHFSLISAYFESHKLKKRSVYNSDQAGMATAIGAYKKFSWLPLFFNYRPVCFALGLYEYSEVKIFHLTGKFICKGLPIRDWFHHYFNEKIFSMLNQLQEKISREEYDFRVAQINLTQKHIENLILDYGLSTFKVN
jgi:hypothetical protein